MKMFLIKKRYINFFNPILKSYTLSKRYICGKTSSTIVLQKRYFSSRTFYDILNVQKSSSKNEIKQAYRKLALKYHPDRNPNNRKESEQKFREITEAYETLSDDNKKKMYDCQLSSGFYSNGMKNNYANMSNSNASYTYQTRKMTDEEIERVFKNVFGNMNINDIFKSNLFNESNFRAKTMGGDIFGNFGSARDYEGNNGNIIQTNIKTEIIPRGNKIIEKTTKIITYKDGNVKQEIIEREISGNSKVHRLDTVPASPFYDSQTASCRIFLLLIDFEDIFNFDVSLKNKIHNFNNSVHNKPIGRNIKEYGQTKLAKQVLNYAYGILSIATRRILVNLFAIFVVPQQLRRENRCDVARMDEELYGWVRSSADLCNVALNCVMR
ncbi:DNAJ like protein, putative [Plasmodium ovale curtisi]|uniref:DNAJ like protein, putative n=1 Tax=Plasmodium ovale curtisi TaxID=864141 RepID=A0A1A8VZP5_PLAOA|nr:DNAJ like protein, putative [Plasmodium ovale curtisi]SBS96398.1 DNAJ like protein, putative [Plasmodium ovale curtisi]